MGLRILCPCSAMCATPWPRVCSLAEQQHLSTINSKEMKVGQLHAMELALATNLSIMPTIDVGHGSELFMAK